MNKGQCKKKMQFQEGRAEGVLVGGAFADLDPQVPKKQWKVKGKALWKEDERRYVRGVRLQVQGKKG